MKFHTKPQIPIYKINPIELQMQLPLRQKPMGELFRLNLATIVFPTKMQFLRICKALPLQQPLIPKFI